jgi:hypothetical protein
MREDAAGTRYPTMLSKHKDGQGWPGQLLADLLFRESCQMSKEITVYRVPNPRKLKRKISNGCIHTFSFHQMLFLLNCYMKVNIVILFSFSKKHHVLYFEIGNLATLLLRQCVHND